MLTPTFLSRTGSVALSLHSYFGIVDLSLSVRRNGNIPSTKVTLAEKKRELFEMTRAIWCFLPEI